MAMARRVMKVLAVYVVEIHGIWRYSLALGVNLSYSVVAAQVISHTFSGLR